MTDILLLRIDAPMVAFGGVRIDKLGVTQRFPGRSMLAGLIGNALGYDHSQFDALQSLQERIRYAARCDRPGTHIVDFQTVDLSQSFMASGWTTRGTPEGREGGTASQGTHIRLNHFIADAAYTVALTLKGPDTPPFLDDVERAIQAPARPLFVGRKCCLPATPLLIGRTSAQSLLSSLKKLSPARSATVAEMDAWWPDDEDMDEPGARQIAVFDDRDWANQIHAGRRWIHEGILHVRS